MIPGWASSVSKGCVMGKRAWARYDRAVGQHQNITKVREKNKETTHKIITWRGATKCFCWYV